MMPIKRILVGSTAALALSLGSTLPADATPQTGHETTSYGQHQWQKHRHGKHCKWVKVRHVRWHKHVKWRDGHKIVRWHKHVWFTWERECKKPKRHHNNPSQHNTHGWYEVHFHDGKPCTKKH